MARNYSSININDFLPYPVHIRPLTDYYPKTEDSSLETFIPGRSKSTNNSKPNGPHSSHTNSECPFDCCQKNLQRIFFPPQYSLMNATIRMKIAGSDKNGINKITDIPCFEKQTIYKGQVTESPVKFEELIREVNGDKIILADQSTLKLTFHQSTSQAGSDKEALGESKQKLFRMNPDSDTQYVWDAERCGWVVVDKEESQAFSSSESRLSYAAAAANWQNRQATQCTAEEWKSGNAPSTRRSSVGGLRSTQQFWNHDAGNDDVRIDQVISGSSQQHIKQQQQYYQYQQQQRSKITVTPISMDEPNAGEVKGQRSVISSTPQSRSYPASASSDISLFDKDELLQMQLNAHLKSFKYLKPSLSSYLNSNNTSLNNKCPSATTPRCGYPPSSPLYQQSHVNNNANNYYKTLNPSSKANFKQKSLHQDNKQVLSPKAALEQYERLRKYWEYQHKLLGSGAIDISNTNNPPLATITKSTMPNYSHQGQGPSSSVSSASASAYYHLQHSLGSSWKQYPSGSGAGGGAVPNQNYPPAALSYWTTGTTGSTPHPYQRQVPLSRGETSPSNNYQETLSRSTLAKSSKLVSRRNSINKNPSPPQPLSSFSMDYQQQLKNLNKLMTVKRPSSNSGNVNIEAMMRNDTMTFERNDNSEIEMPNDNNIKSTETLTPTSISALVEEAITGLEDDVDNVDSPKDLSIPRRHSDQTPTLTMDLPERSKSTGSINDTYDHIVLLDSKSERVKTYMCKRCFETLKSEQEIRNHLFCKMLSNTVQCHVCRCLFKAEEYPEHLKVHAIKAL